MAVGYIISQVAKGLQVVTPDLSSQYFSEPTIVLNAAAPSTGGDTLQTITIRSTDGNLSIPLNRIDTIGGSAPAATPTGIRDQITNLLAGAPGSSLVPTGAATSANQLNEILILGNLDAKFPAQSSGRIPVEVHPNLTASGNLTALNNAVTLTLAGLAGVGIHIGGTFSGTVTFEGTIDGTNWTTLNVAPLAGGVRVSTTTTGGDFEGIGAGLQQVRVRCSAYTSGTISVYILATADTRIRRVWSTSADNFAVKPMLTSGGHITAATSSGSTTAYVAFGSQACSQLTITNDTGVNIEVQQGGSGTNVVVFANTCFTFFGITDASQLGVRRGDVTASSVTVKARWEA